MAGQETPIPLTLALSPETVQNAQITDGTHTVEVAKQGDDLYLTVKTHDESRFSVALTKEGRIHLIFDPTLHGFGINPAEHVQPTPSPLITPEAPHTPESETTTITGNIGRTPILRHHKETGLVFTFPIGVHPEKGVTLWYDVLTSEEIAKEVQKSFEKGQKVAVTGADHTHVQKREGKEDKLVRHFHATEITKAQAKQRS